MIEGKEKKFKKGQIILKEKSFELAIYDVMLGRVGVYINYGTPEEKLVVEIEAGDFLNVISFLLENTLNVGILAVVVLFQPELRKMFENVGRTRFKSLFDEYEKYPLITKQRLYYEAMEEVLPGVKLYIIDENTGVQTALPLSPFASVNMGGEG